MLQRIRQLATTSAPRKALLDVNEVIRDVVSLVRAEAARLEVWRTLDLAAELSPVLDDRVQLKQVTLNLVVLVIVQDSDVGIDASARDELLSAFFTTKSGGMGMGLSISRSIVEAHRGRLSAIPNEPHGAMFHFSLPLAASVG